MFKLECDECHKPIAHEDNHIEIDGIRFIRDRKLAQAQALHFDSKECLNSFVTKAINRPTLITTQGAN